ncbi:winged helix-turn-helix transcriptional regulator [Nannocystis radixulma]|uniref:winged helix-turn-helix transcriptional regulator n=1 Tax=Nannocystis radixulma TaxID=2995305 RepID=UPI0023EEBA3B
MAKPVQPGTCGLSAALAVIAGKWKPTIVWELHARPLRFGELRRAVPGISEKILFEQLRELEAEGVVHREDFHEVPPRVEYSLTPAGSALNTAVHALAEWGTHHTASRASAEAPAERPRE